jgi:uncharacterized protein
LADDVVQALQGDGPLPEVRGTDELVRLGFLHFGDELDQILDLYNAAKNNSALHLTIAPTLGCNFACEYCFQNTYRNDRFMPPAVQKATMAFIEARVNDGRRNVDLVWYGGEPLLGKDILLAMTPAIRTVVERAGGHLDDVRIVTNGSLLDGATAQELRGVGVSQAQISFDALYYVEGEKRGVVNANSAPSPILVNVLTALKFLDVVLRINVSRENKDEIPSILSALRLHGLADKYYLARVDDFAAESSLPRQRTERQTSRRSRVDLPIVRVTSSGNARSATLSPDRSTLSDTTSATSKRTIPRRAYAKMEQDDLTRPEAIQRLADKLTPKRHFCSATSGSMFVIDADGDISRCWESAGVKADSIGNVLEQESTQKEEEINTKWNIYHPLAYSACTSCRVLPLCMGGCSYPRVVMNASNAECTSIRQQIQFCVEEIVKRLRLPDSLDDS